MKKATGICFSESRGWTSRQSPESIGTLPSSPRFKIVLFLLYSFFFLFSLCLVYRFICPVLYYQALPPELISIFILLPIQKDRAPPNWIWLTHHTQCVCVCVCLQSSLFSTTVVCIWWLRLIPCARIWSARPKNVVSSCPNPSSQNISDCANWQECHLASTFGTVTHPNEQSC